MKTIQERARETWERVAVGKASAYAVESALRAQLDEMQAQVEWLRVPITEEYGLARVFDHALDQVLKVLTALRH